MKVKFLPNNIELEIKPNQSVLNLAQDNDIHIQSVCKGIPSCAECRVNIVEGEMNVIPPQAKELDLIGTAYFVDQRRLSCQMKCFGDIVVDLREQVEKADKSTKNPQGRYVKEREDSNARMGSFLEEEVSIDENLVRSDEEEIKELEKANAEREKLLKLQEEYKIKKTENRNDISVAGNSKSNKKKKKKRNNNRRRNKNSNNNNNDNTNSSDKKTTS